MENSYIRNFSVMTDSKIVETICQGIKKIRLDKNLSQDKLSKLSGIDRTTISRLEAGRAANLLTLVQLLRALDRLDLLNIFQIENEISPIRILEDAAVRYKASPRKKK